MKKLLVVGIVLLALSSLFVPAIQVFSFEETRTETPTTYYLKVGKEKDFQIVFTHSIHLTDVIESYRVRKDERIQLVSMQYSDVAIGMPAHAEEGQTLIYEDGIYTLKYDNHKLKEFTLYIGAVDYDLKFKYTTQLFNLKEQLQKGQSYKFSIKRISIFEYMKGERFNG